MYMKTKGLVWKRNHKIQNNGIEESKRDTTVDKRKTVNIWESYITEPYDRPNRPQNLKVEPEEEVDADEKGSYILKNKVEKAIKEMRDKKAAGDDDVPRDVLKLLGEDGLKLMTQLINSIYVTGEWPKDFTEFTITVSNKKPNVTKCSDHCKISLIAHTAKIVARVLRRRIKRKIENVLGED
jgi:hypothetical protein